jgi:Rieske Fe-S protein
MSEPTSRRDFLAVAAAAAATAGCGAADPTSVNSDPGGDPMNFPGSTRSPSNPSGTDTTVCGSTAGLIVGPAAQDLGLNQVLPVPGAPGNVSPLYVCRDSTGIVGLFNKCTHSGCTPNFLPDTAIWLCPCHNSIFGITGNVLRGPAPTNMARYAACKGADGLIRIDLSKKLP